MKYHFINSKNPQYSLEVQIVKGILRSVTMEMPSPLPPDKFQMLMQAISQDIDQMKASLAALSFLPSQSSTPSQGYTPSGSYKVSDWLQYWKKHKGFAYKLTKEDVFKINRIVDADEKEYQAMLEAYFTADRWFCKDHSVGGFLSKQNELRSLLRDLEEKQDGKNLYPSHYDPSFERKLEGAERSAYWRHLRSLGYKPKKDQLGRTLSWEKSSNLSMVANLDSLTNEIVKNKAIS